MTRSGVQCIRRAFSLLEILIVIAIIALLAALAAPAFQSAKLAAMKTATKSNLKQIHQAFILYRDDASGDVGDLYQLGFPPHEEMFKMIDDLGLYPPLRARHPGWGKYYVLIPDPHRGSQQVRDIWRSYNQKCQSSSVYLADFTFSDVPLDEPSPYLSKRAIGIALGGSLVEQRSFGYPFMPTWWVCPQGE